MKKTALIMALIITIISCMGISCNAQSKSKIVYKNTLIKTLKAKGYDSIDRIKCIDKYVEGHWYVYYVYADGDCYVITIKNNKTQKCVQLN